MTEHVLLTDPELHEPKGASTAVAGQLLQANGDGTTGWVSTSAATSSVRLVASLSDLPDPVGSTIQLLDDTVYEQVSSFSLNSYTIVHGSNSTYKGASSIGITLTYEGSGDVFYSAGNTCAVSDLTVIAASGRAFNHDPTSLKIMRITDVSLAVDRIASFSGTDWAVRMTNVSALVMTSGGVTCSGTCRSFNWDTAGIIPTAGIILDLGTCVFESFVVSTLVYNLPTGTTFISGLAGSANVNSSGFARVVHTQGTDTGGTALSGVSTDDVRWDFGGNFPLQDTMADGFITLAGNTTSTAITAGVYSIVSGTWNVERTSQFTGTSGGRLTYDGVRNLITPITTRLVLSPDSGTNVGVSIAIFKNGTVITNSITTVEGVTSADSISVTTPWQDELEPGDYIDIRITTDTGASLTVTSAQVRLN